MRMCYNDTVKKESAPGSPEKARPGTLTQTNPRRAAAPPL
nr:MAG TPA: hypothetical protein [Caudoviricetes sp.]